MLKKSLGQHFLNNKGVITKIVDVADPQPDSNILEIGPGDGVLTTEILSRGVNLTAIETDAVMIEKLAEKFGDRDDLNLIHADVQQWDETQLCSSTGGYSIIANIPYYITGFIIRKFLESSCQPQKMTLIMQKEVAQRIMAHDKKESLLSISVKAYGTPKMHDTIKAGSFTPPPKVDSAILTIDTISKDFFDGISEAAFFKIAKVGFGHKRKQLVKNLSDILDPGHVKELLRDQGLAENVRAEDLTLETWKALAALVK